MGTYITTDGFDKKTLAEIKAELEAEFQSIFGNDIDLEEDQPFGQMIGIISKRDADLWDALQEIYTSRNPKEAIGVSLDNIVQENGLTRIAATATQVKNVLLYGDAGTVIAAGKLVKTPDKTVEYELDSSTTIDTTVAFYGRISVDSVTTGNDYTITIDGTAYTYTALAADEEIDVLQELETLINAGTWTGTVAVDTDDVELSLTGTENFNFSTTGDLTIEEVAVVGDFTATETGANTVPANTLTEIVTAVSGWNSVTNPSAGITGNDTETDSELRLRREQSVNGVGNATEDSIRSKILDEITGVTGCTIYSNRGDSTDTENRPPHSFETVVQGGDDDEIAEKIWETQPAGIQSIGNINSDGSISSTIPGTGINITDSQGFTQNILYSRPENIYIFVRVSRDKYSEEEYPTDGDDLIKDAIVAWSLEISNIDVGKDVIRQRLSAPVYTIPGIEDIKIELDGDTDSAAIPSYAESNIDVSDRQIAVFAISRIVVQDLT